MGEPGRGSALYPAPVGSGVVGAEWSPGEPGRALGGLPTLLPGPAAAEAFAHARGAA